MSSPEPSERTTFGVGVGVLLVNNTGQILLAKRLASGSGFGEYAAVGGGLEPGESLEEAMRREISEECGDDIETSNLRRISVMNWRPRGELQWIGIGATAKLVKGVPCRMEPHKIAEWGWYDLDNLPRPLYEPTAWTIDSYRTGEMWHE